MHKLIFMLLVFKVGPMSSALYIWGYFTAKIRSLKKESPIFLHLNYLNWISQFISKLGAADVAGEIGVILNIPQPFTVRTKRLSQVIRISHQHFKQTAQQHNADGKTIISNFIQVWNLFTFHPIKLLLSCKSSTSPRTLCRFPYGSQKLKNQ